jgi:hypothetical protein
VAERLRKRSRSHAGLPGTAFNDRTLDLQHPLVVISVLSFGVLLAVLPLLTPKQHIFQPPVPKLCNRLTQLQLIDHVTIASPTPDWGSYFSFKKWALFPDATAHGN